MVKTKAGMTDEYLKELAKTLKASLEEQKKQNLVVDYKILLGNAATPQDFNILIMVESKNMAAHKRPEIPLSTQGSVQEIQFLSRRRCQGRGRL